MFSMILREVFCCLGIFFFFSDVSGGRGRVGFTFTKIYFTFSSYNAIKAYKKEGKLESLSATEHLVSAAEAGEFKCKGDWLFLAFPYVVPCLCVPVLLFLTGGKGKCSSPNAVIYHHK